MENAKIDAVRSSIVQILRNTIKGIVPADSPVPIKEVDALAQLCMMSIVPTGEEDPKEFLRSISDSILEHFMVKFDEFQENPVLGKIAQFFLIEWCHRQGHLNGDWAWRWDTPSEGRVSYSAKIPLEEVELPTRLSTESS